jgi:hypothetical protein
MNPAATLKPKRTAMLWPVPAVLFAGDALAWGLCTHVYFAQLLVRAVDGHVARHLFCPAFSLLQADDWLLDCVACNIECTPAASRRAIRQLAGAERLLRESRLPDVLHRMGACSIASSPRASITTSGSHLAAAADESRAGRRSAGLAGRLPARRRGARTHRRAA